jgi:hypothetical protein
MANNRAVKYRRLALAEPDPEKVHLLHRLADESDRDLLFTARWLWRPSVVPELPKTDVGKTPGPAPVRSFHFPSFRLLGQ